MRGVGEATPHWEDFVCQLKNLSLSRKEAKPLMGLNRGVT